MKVFIGADHNGYLLKEKLEKYLQKVGYDVVDEGARKPQSDDDFPVFASRVVTDMLSSDLHDPRGILICGSGQGMAIAANRFKGIRAVVLQDEEQARLSRNDDDANVLALPAYELKNDPEKVFRIVETWLSTPFESIARRVRRLQQLDELG
ncbi:MAG: RpiB/LacA/LacB family sugar-phosphate isomerase [Patescibacteria group bacterium]